MCKFLSFSGHPENASGQAMDPIALGCAVKLSSAIDISRLLSGWLKNFMAHFIGAQLIDSSSNFPKNINTEQKLAIPLVEIALVNR
jgi:hypothetical protein